MPDARIRYIHIPGQPAEPLKIVVYLPDGARIYVLLSIAEDGKIFLSATLRHPARPRGRNATTMIMWASER